MSRGRTLIGLLPRLPTVLRTLRHVRPAQARAQLSHMLRGPRAPMRLGRGAPNLAVDRAATAFLAPSPHVLAAPSDAGGATVTLLGRSLHVLEGEIDWSEAVHGPLWAYHLHEQAWLRHPDLPAATRAALVRGLDRAASAGRGLGSAPHLPATALLGQAPADGGGARRRGGRRGPSGSAGGDDRVDGGSGGDPGARTRDPACRRTTLLSNLVGVVWDGAALRGGTRPTDGSRARRAWSPSSRPRFASTAVTKSAAPCITRSCSRTCSTSRTSRGVAPRTPEGLAETLDRFAEAHAVGAGALHDARRTHRADGRFRLGRRRRSGRALRLRSASRRDRRGAGSRGSGLRGRGLRTPGGPGLST